MRLGDLDALKEDFKSRLTLCNDWIEKAKDKETKIRASAVKTFIGEVIMTIDNAPTVEPETKVVANVTFNKEQLEEIVEKAKADILAQFERPQGEWIPVTYRPMTEEEEKEFCETLGIKEGSLENWEKKVFTCRLPDDGLDKQLNILQEECAELIQAVSKYKRTRTTAIVEEMADVYIMLYQITYLLNKEVASVEVEDYIALWMEKKIRRQLERIQNESQ